MQNENYRDTTDIPPISKSFSQSIAQKISVQGQNTRIILLVGTARSGTTAFLRVFSEEGIESWFQPIKHIIRGRIHHNKEYSLQISDAPYIMIKETMGGMTEPEIWYNPIEILLEAGVAKANIHLITVMREPISVACSLIRNRTIDLMRNGTINPVSLDAKANMVSFVEKYARGYESTIRLIAYAKEYQIEYTPFIYELLRDQDPEVIRKRLLDRVGVAYTKAKMNWSNLPPIETSTKLSKFTSQWDTNDGSNLFITLNRSNGLTYFDEPADELTKYVTDSELSALKRSGAFDIYHTYREMCYAFWGLSGIVQNHAQWAPG